MTIQLKTFLVSLLTPGLGYLYNNDKKNFFKTIFIFFSVIILAVSLRLITGFAGFALVLVALPAIYLFAAIHATFQAKTLSREINNTGLLKLFFTLAFLLITGLSFANRRAVMGFDIMSMSVPVMSPTVLQGDKFLADTWAYKNNLPKRGHIIVHSFNGQQGLFVNRIIAIENDKIEIKNGFTFLNGQILSEPYVSPLNATRLQSKTMNAMIVPKGCYFVMGDNRDASFGDSRFSGTITMENIEGKITDIIYSADKTKIGSTVK